jgi:Sulfotransferase domain
VADGTAIAAAKRISRVRRSARPPNFIIIGAMKSGTTSLFHYLQAHPQAHMSPLKEVEFFVEERNWRRGFDWYRAQFAGAHPETIAIGEVSTTYTKYPEFKGVPERIAKHLPDARLIYVLRDPIERIRSHYQHRVLSGAVPPALPARDVLLATSERLRSSRAETLRSVYGFLGIDPTFVSDVIDQESYRSEESAAYPPIAWWLPRTVKRYSRPGSGSRR